MDDLLLNRTAILSPCRSFRYRLERDVSHDGLVAAIIGVNPSVADAEIDDATIRKDMGFARRFGWRKIIKGNKFAYRATDVRELRRTADPVGSSISYPSTSRPREATPARIILRV